MIEQDESGLGLETYHTLKGEFFTTDGKATAALEVGLYLRM